MEIVANLNWIETWANAQRGKNGVPIHIERPWLKKQAQMRVHAPTEDDLRQRQALAERLGLT